MSILSSIFFILIFSTFLLANYFLYFAIIDFFKIKKTLLKWFIKSLIILLTISFVFSFVLIRTNNIEITRWFYIIASLWGGFMINFLLATILLYATHFFFRRKKTEINKSLLATIFFSIALLVSVGGIFNALNPRIKNTEVAIIDLPEQWIGKKIAHLSDVHIGPVNRKIFLDKIIKEINKIDVEMVLITGDFFDGTERGLDFVSNSLRAIKAPLGVYFVNGNHETYNYKLNFQEILKEGGVKVLNDKMIEIDGLNVMGISYREQNAGGLVEMIKFLNKNKNNNPVILLYHAPNKIKEISQEGVDLQLSGHTHAGQIFPMNIITNMIYKGYNHGLYKIGEYSLHISSGAGTWGPIMRIGNYPEISIIKLIKK